MGVGKDILTSLEKNKNVVLGGFIFLLVVYIITKSLLVGIFTALSLFLYIYLDFRTSIRSHGWKHEAKELIIAIIIALVIWFGLGFILHTSSPVNAVVSCSMLPVLQRGDLIILYGGEPVGPVVELDDSDIQNITPLAKVFYKDKFITEVNGSLLIHCVETGFKEDYCLMFRRDPGEFYELHGPVKFKYGVCKKKMIDDGRIVSTICVRGLEVGNLSEDLFPNPALLNQSIIVYTPKKGDLFSSTGDIIHRVILILRDSNGDVYYLTKGDNNPISDLQMCSNERCNSIITQDQYKGKVLFRIPYIGYVKLVLSLKLDLPPGCESYYLGS